ncbi:histidine kinase [Thermodesulfobacteriota bacterium]
MDNRRILVIDDDPEIREIYQKIIAPAEGTSENYRDQISQLLSLDDNEKQKFTLEIASQGQEGFSLVQKGLAEDKPFALAFIDIRMPPGWGGISTAARIREIDPNIEIVIVTAFSDRSLEEIIHAVGTPEKLILLRKPFDHEEIIQLSFALTEKWNLARKEELQRVELQSILMTSPAAIFTVNKDRIITSWNLAAEKITGYPADEVVGKVCIYQRVAVDQRCKKCALNFEQPLNGNVQNREIEIRDKSGDRHVVSKSIAYLKDNKGRVIQAIESFWDITPLEEAHLKLADEIVKRKNIAKESAVLAERSRLARELHDSVSQSLYSVSLIGETARHLAEAGDLKNSLASLGELNSTVQQTLKEMRLLIYNLRPEILKKEGFKAAIQQRLDAVESRSGIKGQLLIDKGDELSELEEDTFYRIIQEALNNTLKHSSATMVTVKVLTTKDTAEIQVSDDGIGFETDSIAGNGGMGLTSIKERAENLGGVFSFNSSPGKGTLLKITVPRNS